jgi:hypothetical protein
LGHDLLQLLLDLVPETVLFLVVALVVVIPVGVVILARRVELPPLRVLNDEVVVSTH